MALPPYSCIHRWGEVSPALKGRWLRKDPGRERQGHEASKSGGYEWQRSKEATFAAKEERGVEEVE